MNYFSMFSGIAGFEKGIEDATDQSTQYATSQSEQTKCEEWRERAFDEDERNLCIRHESTSSRDSWKCIGYSEIDKYATAIYRYHYPEHINYGDCRTIDPIRLPDFDLIVGGFPCQSFSIAGKRGGFKDTRGTLFFEIARITRVKRPGYLWLENVKGLLSHDEGNTFATIISTLDELGYDCQWQVLNSKNHGVPQNRERVFIIGNLRGQRRPKVFPIGEADGIYPETNEAVVNCLDANYGKGWLDHGQRTMIHTAYPGEVREYEDCSPAISTPAGGGYLPMIKYGTSQDQKLSRDISQTLNSGHFNVPKIAQALQTDGQLRTGTSWDSDKPQSSRNIRRLTPIECERLQGFPDNWTKYGIDDRGKQLEISDTQRYKCCGNAVTTNVIRDIALVFMQSVLENKE